MHAPGQRTANDYRILVRPIEGLTRATHDDIPIATSRAAKVVYETRFPGVIYFPRSDITASLRPNPTKRTFCPFKGTAHYFDMEVDGEWIEAAAWRYESPLPEAEAVTDHIAFASSGAVIDVDGAPVPPEPDGHLVGPVVDWLLRDAPLIKSPAALTKAFAEKLLEDGLPVSRISILTWSLHPLIAGRNHVWRTGDPEVVTRTPSYDLLSRPEYINSPLRHVANGNGGVRQRLDGDDGEFSFPIMADLKAKGATDYVAMPLFFSRGPINVITLASDHPDGFSTANLGLVFECSFILGRLYETFVLRDNFTALLDTYLGNRTGARVLSGEIRRGDGDEIDAAILYCDIRGSTKLEAELHRSDYFSVLNGFFDIVDEIVTENNGEVLKFIGDAVLAVFPEGDEAGRSCRQAAQSAREISAKLAGLPTGPSGQPLRCAIGVSFGNVVYGNVGSLKRLDFTVIGAAANIAARLTEHGKDVGKPIVITANVARHLTEGIEPLGAVSLRGVPAPTEAYAIN
ncbi:MAG: DUF427 domain-containing protein [Pseudomonadota bacterium]